MPSVYAEMATPIINNDRGIITIPINIKVNNALDAAAQDISSFVRSDFTFAKVDGDELDNMSTLLEGSGSTYNLYIYPEIGKRGSFTVNVTGSVLIDNEINTIDGTELTIAYDTSAASPEFRILTKTRPPGTPIAIYIIATDPIYGLNADSLSIDVGSIDTVRGYGTFHIATWTPTTSQSGTATLTILKDTINWARGTAPKTDLTFNIDYDTRERTESSTTTTRKAVFTYNYDSENVFNIEENLGSFNDVIETQKVASHIYMLVERIKYGGEHIQFSQPFALTVGGNLRVFDQHAAVLLRANISSSSPSLTVIKAYDHISLAAHSLTVHNSRLYWLEGSHYNAYNEGLKTQRADEDKPVSFLISQMIRTSTSSSEDKRYWITGNTITMNLDSEAENFNEIYNFFNAEDEEGIIKYITINEKRPFSLPQDNLSEILISISNIDISDNGDGRFQFIQFDYHIIEGSFPAVDTTSDVYLYFNAVNRYQINRLWDVPVNWKTTVGRLMSISNNENSPTNHGRVFINQEDNENIYDNIEKTWDSEDYQDNYVGTHLGIVNKILGRTTTNEIQLITGYGKLDNIDDTNSVAARIGNWEKVSFSNKLEQRIPVLLTNNKTIANILNDFSVITDSIYGIDNNKFFYRPRDVIRGKLTLAITDTNVSGLSISNLNRDSITRSSGTLLINNELINFASVNGTTVPTTLTRGTYGTTATAHDANDEIILVDHILSIYDINLNTLSFKTEYQALYNRIVIEYGDGLQIIKEDVNSINAYGIRPLIKNISLDRSQVQLVNYVAEKLLESYKKLKITVRFTTRSIFKLNPQGRLIVGNSLYISETDRSDLKGIFQIKDIKQNLGDGITIIELVST